MIADDAARDILEKLAALSSAFAEHKTASTRRSDDIVEHMHSVTAAQRSTGSQIHELRVDVMRATELSKKAIETALESKRIAAESVLESKAILDGMMAQHQGLDLMLARQDAELAAIRKETAAQTSTLAELRNADVAQTHILQDLRTGEAERKIREHERAELAKESANKIDRSIKNGAGLLGIIVTVGGGVVWALSHFVR